MARGVGSRGRGPPVVNVDLGGGGDAAGALSPRAPAGCGATRGSPTLQEGQGHSAAAEAGAAGPPPAPHSGQPGRLPRGTLAGSARVTADSSGLAGGIRTERQRGDKDRLQAWRDWLDEAWSSKQGAVYKWLKGESFAAPVTFLVGPDGTPTANLREMDSLLQDAWRPINRKYAEAAEPDPAEFLRRYGRHVRCVPMISGPLTGRRLRRALMRMDPSALGLDGWSLEDLRALPDQLLEWLADLLREVDGKGGGRCASPRATRPSSPKRAHRGR